MNKNTLLECAMFYYLILNFINYIKSNQFNYKSEFNHQNCPPYTIKPKDVFNIKRNYAIWCPTSFSSKPLFTLLF